MPKRAPERQQKQMAICRSIGQGCRAMLGNRLGARAYLRTALPRGARLVVAGGEYLRDGAPVTVEK